MEKNKNRRQLQYENEVTKALAEKFGYKNAMSIPKILSIVVTRGIPAEDAKGDTLEAHMKDMAMITGQKACPCYSKKAISNFKLRDGLPIGMKVTLRRERMYAFLDRLISITFPRIRDFKGFSKKKVNVSCYNFGISDQRVVEEVALLERKYGFNVNIITSATSSEETLALLEAFGFPFMK